MSALLAACLSLVSITADDRPCVIVVVGTEGTREYGAQFRHWADQWQTAAKNGSAECIRLGEDQAAADQDRDRLQSLLAERSAPSKEPLWLVLIGHGTYDGHDARFNLRGPDVTDAELAQWLAALKRPVIVIDCSSSSAPFLNRLSGENRVIITATKSGHESNFTRLGQYLADAIGDVRADLDKDGQVSLLEAFLSASSRVEEFYRTDGRLATEHALIDDNGDRLGTPAEWFRGVRATRRAKDGAALDGVRAHQICLIPSDRERLIPPEIREKRNTLELAIAALRDKKERLPENSYYEQLEPLMLELARLYRDLPAGSPKPADSAR